jgi:MraZ protein
MLVGEYEYKVDIKGRLPLPPKFRQEFRDGLVLTRGPEKCVVVYKKEDFEKLAQSLAAQTLNRSNLRRLNRFILGSAFEAEMDGQGRIALHPSLREYAEIDDTAVLVGSNNCIEIWSPTLWETEKNAAEEQAWQIIESLEGAK